MPSPATRTRTATPDEVLRWITEGVFQIERGEETRIIKNGQELVQRINKRKNSHRGDPRVDLWHEGKRRSCNVSHLVWMLCTGRVIPEGFEIHHADEDPLNNSFENLVCVHPLDHGKLHNQVGDEVPF